MTGVELIGRDAQVEEHAIDAVDAQLLEHPVDLAEVAVAQHHPVTEGSQGLRRGLQRVLVPIQSDQDAVGSSGLEDQSGMAAAAQSAVDKDLSRLRLQALQNFGRQHGSMLEIASTRHLESQIVKGLRIFVDQRLGGAHHLFVLAAVPELNLVKRADQHHLAHLFQPGIFA